jgi:hypothetical protein
MDINPVFEAHMNSGLEWLEPDSEPVLNWDARDVCFEDARNVLSFYMAHLPEEERTQLWSGNYATVLMGARKPDPEIVLLR